MLQQSLAVFLVLALLLAALWLLRRQGLATYALAAGSKGFGSKAFGWRNRDRRLQLVERLALTPQHSLHLVSIGDQMVIFATSPAGCVRVDQAPWPQSVSPESSGSLKSGASC